MLDILKIRKDTPHCEDRIFLNSAGSSLMPLPVVDRMKNYLDEESKHGGYKLYDLYVDEIKEFYTEVAKLLNCQTRNVAFAFNATDAFAQALYAIPFEKGDIIITTDDDYVSNHIQFYALYKRFAVQTIRVNNLENGSIDLTHLERLIKEHRPKLISVTHVPTNTGKVQDVESVGRLCAQNDVLYMVDACQSVGQMPVDVEKIKCDFLCVTGRKFLRGPRGTGFLFVSDRVLQRGLYPLRLDGWSANWVAPNRFEFHASAQRYEVYEQSYACTLGLKEAVKYANQIGLDNIYVYNQTLLHRLTSTLAQQEDILFLDRGEKMVNIFTFQKKGVSKENLENALAKHNVYFSTASRGSALIDFDKKGVDWAIRLSPHYFNTMEEMDRVAEIIASI
ncbi:MAG: aminotransferase class V-fold PLP-dependent enzyme [Saprospiraceae bacterium]|nr:aminotransferase class V-fold PLP-dependent enzyme [Saprospiraceae bacterium]